MDTGGKIATGILVPVGVGIVGLASYMIYDHYRQKQKHKQQKWEEDWDKKIGTGTHGIQFLGGKRRTHRRRR